LASVKMLSMADLLQPQKTGGQVFDKAAVRIEQLSNDWQSCIKVCSPGTISFESYQLGWLSTEQTPK